MLHSYSGGQNWMHNVEARTRAFGPGYLDLSNTSGTRKTLSLSKPPHSKSSYAASLTVPDGIRLPGKGKERNPSGFRQQGSSPFRTVPSEEAYYWP